MSEGLTGNDTRERVAGLGAWALSSLARSGRERAPSVGEVDGARGLGSVVADRYLLKAYLGRGRYGEVYRAVDRALSDPQLGQEHSVAVQLLHRGLSGQTRLLQKLEASYQQPHLWAHPNVLRVHGFGCDRGQYFLVTELLDGASLRAVLDEIPSALPTEAETLAMLRAVGDALKYAHAKGAIHGDIRPEKVFLTTDCAVKVLDLLPAGAPRTAPFFVEDAGPSGVAAPDPRDDVYGLACLAYELFAGRHPFNASSPLEASNAGLTAVPIPQLGEHRWNAIARGLALRRERRTASVSAFLAELGVTGEETLRSVDETPASPPPPASAPAAAARARDDDVPIIGDYSAGAARREPAPPPTLSATGGENQAPWRLDPHDLPRYAEPATPREPRGRGLRFAPVLLFVAAVVAAVYWGPEPWRTRGLAWLAMARTVVDDALNGRAEAARGAGPEEPAVAPAPATPAASDPVPSVATEPPAVSAPPPAAAAVAPSKPATPVAAAPERFEFASPVVSVSESRASVAVEIRRRGGDLGDSSAVWWTSDGSASAPEDYVGFGATIEKFAAGETVRTIHIPIVGDSKPERRENFFVNLRGRERPVGGLEPAQRVEIVILDDD